MPKAMWFAIRQSSLPKLLSGLLVFSCAVTIGSLAQEFSTLTNFIGPNGYLPVAGITLGADGNFYGTTFDGGVGNGSSACAPTQGCGTVFKVTPTGTLTTLYSFCSQPSCADGSYPYAGLALGADGNLYGTTESGGTGCSSSGGCGTVFKITPSGTLTTLYSFCTQQNCQDGDAPAAALLLASDGNFYGTTNFGGTGYYGTVFKITPGGTLTTLYNFCSHVSCFDGSQPAASLIQATDGNLYGTTSAGGISGVGTVFRITLAGALSTLHSFNGTQGADPVAALVQASDGNFYGTTQAGGGLSLDCQPSSCGTVFQITPGGAFALLHSFSGVDGGNAGAGLMQAADGNLYGTTWNGGVGSYGALFKITTLGMLTKVYDFNPYDASVGPRGTLLQAPDGGFYGTASAGGHSLAQGGTVFRLVLPLQFVSVPPCRLVDTRQTGGPIEGGTARNFNIAQLGGCGIPASAAAYSLNVTAAPNGPLSYLTVWPQGESQPDVSTLNSLDGRTKANAAIVASVNNSVSVYVSDTTDVILDIDGYFTPPNSQTLQFYPLTPCRLVDTRQANGPLGGPRLAAQQERDFPLLTSSCIPSGVNPVAYSLNITAVPNPQLQPLGYLTVWPAGQPQPDVSTLNNPTATVVANAAVAAAGQNGEVAVYPYDTTDLLIDINGYFAAPGQGSYSFYTIAPCRAYDRRSFGQPFSGEISVDIANSLCPPPINATGYVFNATVVPSPTLGYLTLWSDGQPQPEVSTLNAYDGFVTSNMAIVPTLNCCIDAYAGDGSTQLILDMSGYFAP